MDTYGKKAVNNDSPEPDDLADHYHSDPHLISWSALKEARSLQHIVHSHPILEEYSDAMDAAVDTIRRVDNVIFGKDL